MVKQQIEKVLTTEMDRKDFLKHVGLAVVAVAGVGSLLSALGRFGQVHSSRSSNGYGGSPYGR